jgi:hypothetical protein
MKLAAIYNVWDGAELLQGSINCLKDHVDKVIMVYQDVSNFGEKYSPLEILSNLEAPGLVLVRFTPNLKKSGGQNETTKRNVGLETAKGFQCTHFLHMDCDEYYQDFGKAKEMYQDLGRKGSVCRLLTYFKKPTLRLKQPENYYVPFIHELRHNTIAGATKYPYYVDPTRRINQTDVVELPLFMHHYSWVRKDVMRKVRNSTARKNMEGKTYLQDYNADLKPGDYLPCYEQTLIETEDFFNINSML